MTTTPYRVLVTGSRYWPDRQAVYDALDDALLSAPRRPLIVVHGACRTGADIHAHLWTVSASVTVDVIEEAHPADWTTHGKAAGPIRNQEMVAAGADLVLAFPLPNSRGTHHTMSLAEAAGIPVRRWTA
jgi:hypothetical protein